MSGNPPPQRGTPLKGTPTTPLKTPPSSSTTKPISTTSPIPTKTTPTSPVTTRSGPISGQPLSQASSIKKQSSLLSSTSTLSTARVLNSSPTSVGQSTQGTPLRGGTVKPSGNVIFGQPTTLSSSQSTLGQPRQLRSQQITTQNGPKKTLVGSTSVFSGNGGTKTVGSRPVQGVQGGLTTQGSLTAQGSLTTQGAKNTQNQPNQGLNATSTPVKGSSKVQRTAGLDNTQVESKVNENNGQNEEDIDKNEENIEKNNQNNDSNINDSVPNVEITSETITRDDVSSELQSPEGSNVLFRGVDQGDLGDNLLNDVSNDAISTDNNVVVTNQDDDYDINSNNVNNNNNGNNINRVDNDNNNISSDSNNNEVIATTSNITLSQHSQKINQQNGEQNDENVENNEKNQQNEKNIQNLDENIPLDHQIPSSYVSTTSIPQSQQSQNSLQLSSQQSNQQAPNFPRQNSSRAPLSHHNSDIMSSTPSNNTTTSNNTTNTQHSIVNQSSTPMMMMSSKTTLPSQMSSAQHSRKNSGIQQGTSFGTQNIANSQPISAPDPDGIFEQNSQNLTIPSENLPHSLSNQNSSISKLATSANTTLSNSSKTSNLLSMSSIGQNRVENDTVGTGGQAISLPTEPGLGSNLPSNDPPTRPNQPRGPQYTFNEAAVLKSQEDNKILVEKFENEENNLDKNEIKNTNQTNNFPPQQSKLAAQLQQKNDEKNELNINMMLGVGGQDDFFGQKLDNNDDDEDDDFDEDEDGDEDEDEEEESEPILRYQRLSLFKSVQQQQRTPEQEAAMTDKEKKAQRKLLDRGTLSATYCHEKYLLLGTTTGKIIQLDLQGNEVMRMNCHVNAITCISADLGGEFIATASQDGTVNITNIFTKEQTSLKFNSSVLSLAISPHFKSTQQNVVVGLNNGQVILATKGWLSYKNTILHENEGPVNALAWNHDSGLFAWATNLGVKVLDINLGERISFITKPPNNYADNIGATAHLTWARGDVLIIGWGNTIKVCQVRHRNIDLVVGHTSRAESSHDSTPTAPQPHNTGPNQVAGNHPKGNRYMQVITMFEVGDLIAGVAVVNEFIALLICHYQLTPPDSTPSDPQIEKKDTITKTKIGPTGQETNKQKLAVLDKYTILPPEVRLVTYTGEIQTSDALVLHGFSSTTYKQLKLVSLSGHDPLLYISNHSDIILAALVEMHEKIMWLYTHKFYLRGVVLTAEKFIYLQAAKKQWFIECYLWSLVKDKNFILLAQECFRLLPTIGSLTNLQLQISTQKNTKNGNTTNTNNFEQSVISGNQLQQVQTGIVGPTVISSQGDREKVHNIVSIWEFWLQVFVQCNALHIFIPFLGPLHVVLEPQTELHCMTNPLVKLPFLEKTTHSHASLNYSSDQGIVHLDPSQTNISDYTIIDIVRRYLQFIHPPRQHIPTNIDEITPPQVNKHLLSTDTYSLDAFAPLFNHNTVLSSTFFQQPTIFPFDSADTPTTTIINECYDVDTYEYRLVSLPITPIPWKYSHRLASQILSHKNVNLRHQTHTTPLIIHSHMLTTIILQLLREKTYTLAYLLLQRHSTATYSFPLVLQAIYSIINQHLAQVEGNTGTGSQMGQGKAGNANIVSIEHRITNLSYAFELLNRLTRQIPLESIQVAYQNREPTISIMYGSVSNVSNGVNTKNNPNPQQNSNSNSNNNNNLTILYDMLLHIFKQQHQYSDVIAICSLTGNPMLFEYVTSSCLSQPQVIQQLEPYILGLALFHPYDCIHMLALLYQEQQKQIKEMKNNNNNNNNNTVTGPTHTSYDDDEPHQTDNSFQSSLVSNQQDYSKKIALGILSVQHVVERLQLVPQLLYYYFSVLHKADLESSQTHRTGSTQGYNSSNSLTASGLSSSSSLSSSFFSSTGSYINYNQPIINTYITKVLPVYVQFATDNELLHFLRTNITYKLETAVSLCREFGRIPALVFLYYRTGNLKDAIALLLTPTSYQQQQIQLLQLCDSTGGGGGLTPQQRQTIEQNIKQQQLQYLQHAIEIVVDSNDSSLWDVVFNFCLRDPTSLTYLLDYASMFLFAVNSPIITLPQNDNLSHLTAQQQLQYLLSHANTNGQNSNQLNTSSANTTTGGNNTANGGNKVDVITLLQKIPKNVQIPDLQRVLYAIVHNAYLHLTLTQTVYRTAQHDYSQTAKKHYLWRKKGIVVNTRQIGLYKLLEHKRHDNNLQRQQSNNKTMNLRSDVEYATYTSSMSAPIIDQQTIEMKKLMGNKTLCCFCHQSCLMNAREIAKMALQNQEKNDQSLFNYDNVDGDDGNNLHIVDDDGVLMYGCGHIAHKVCVNQINGYNGDAKDGTNANNTTTAPRQSNNRRSLNRYDAQNQHDAHHCPYCYSTIGVK